ncbi:hypothetical protein ACAW74_11065 [Fibrella sp. WM1]|uniref:hypothetical protein n=1 Tax=Fibrella musci TaxID=3242485 RepID=UPI003521A79A
MTKMGHEPAHRRGHSDEPTEVNDEAAFLPNDHVPSPANVPLRRSDNVPTQSIA